jgi:ankyrin repeat protein
LHLNSWIGDVNIIDRLLAKNLNVNKQNIAGWTPLHCACYNGHLAIVKLFLEHGADYTLRTNRGQTAFDLVTDPELEGYLSAYQFDVKEPDIQ